jgi:hypothetical protein
MLKKMMLSVTTAAVLIGGTAMPDNVIPTHVVAATAAVKTDPWGRTIRTTNLPKNYKDYPYILANLPNEMYEMEHKNVIGKPLTAAEFVAQDRVTKDIIDGWMAKIKQYGQQTLNINYKTINKDVWLQKYLSVMVNQGEVTKSNALEYYNWVIKNHIQIEGNLTPEPSMIFKKNGDVFVRSTITFTIKGYVDNKDIFNDFWFLPNKYKKNVKYVGYTDIALSSNVYGGNLSDYKISGDVSFFRYSKIK